jgi:hypothetical protein
MWLDIPKTLPIIVIWKWPYSAAAIVQAQVRKSAKFRQVPPSPRGKMRAT